MSHLPDPSFGSRSGFGFKRGFPASAGRSVLFRVPGGSSGGKLLATGIGPADGRDGDGGADYLEWSGIAGSGFRHVSGGVWGRACPKRGDFAWWICS